MLLQGSGLQMLVVKLIAFHKCHFKLLALFGGQRTIERKRWRSQSFSLKVDSSLRLSDGQCSWQRWLVSKVNNIPEKKFITGKWPCPDRLEFNLKALGPERRPGSEPCLQWLSLPGIKWLKSKSWALRTIHVGITMEMKYHSSSITLDLRVIS